MDGSHELVGGSHESVGGSHESRPVASAFRRKTLWALLLCATAVYFVALGNASIWDANEAFYVETPREMLEAHDLVNPSFNYLPRFNKPVLSYWIVAALYKAFGVSIAVQRFGIALGALLIIACAFALAGCGIQDSRFTIQDEGSRIKDSSLWAAAGLAASPRMVMFARRIFIDVWLTAFMALTLTFFALSERYPERRRVYLPLMYVSIGLGVLTKGPVAIALPAVAFGLYFAVTRRFARIAELKIPLGIAIVAAIVLPWYAALYRQHGWTYIRSFLVSENVERFTSGLGVGLRRPFWYYLPVMLSDSFPLSIFLPAAAVAAWRQRSAHQCLLWCWIVSIVAFFSLSAGKQDLYIFPIVPAVAALGGLAIARGTGDEPWRRWITATVLVAGVLVALAGGGVLALFATAARIYALNAALAVGACALAGGALTLAFAVGRRPAAAAAVLLCTMIAVDWVFVLRVLPDFEKYKPVPEITVSLQERLKPGDRIAHYRIALPSMAYYLRGHFDGFDSRDEFIAFMRSGRHVYAVLRADDYAELEGALAPGTCVVSQWDFFQTKLKDIVSQRPLPKIVVVDNRCGGS